MPPEEEQIPKERVYPIQHKPPSSAYKSVDPQEGEYVDIEDFKPMEDVKISHLKKKHFSVNQKKVSKSDIHFYEHRQKIEDENSVSYSLESDVQDRQPVKVGEVKRDWVKKRD